MPVGSANASLSIEEAEAAGCGDSGWGGASDETGAGVVATASIDARSSVLDASLDWPSLSFEVCGLEFEGVVLSAPAWAGVLTAGMGSSGTMFTAAEIVTGNAIGIGAAPRFAFAKDSSTSGAALLVPFAPVAIALVASICREGPAALANVGATGVTGAGLF